MLSSLLRAVSRSFICVLAGDFFFFPVTNQFFFFFKANCNTFVCAHCVRFLSQVCYNTFGSSDFLFIYFFFGKDEALCKKQTVILSPSFFTGEKEQ